VTAQKTGQAPNPALGQKQGDVPAITMRFGGGMNTRELATDIDDRECADGSQNFGLDLFSAAFFPRAPFDLVGTAPNGQSINGFAQLQKQDGTLSTLIQAGTALYKWDGVSFTNIATVPFGSKLRGAYNANFPALNKVLVTDLALQQVVSTWDGTTFAALAHNLGGGVNFFAKYSLVSKERAWFANVTAGSATPHVILASAVGDPTNLTTANKPSLSLGVGDPFFVQTQDMSPINGFAEFLTDKYVSTQRGSLNFIHGIDGRDMQIDQKYPFIGAVGDEAMTYIGNDVAYGRMGRIETMFGTINYGDVETQELSRAIQNKIAGVTGWTLVYDPILYRLYCFPTGVSQCWVYYKSITDDWVNRYYRKDGLPIRSSAWSLWTTAHALAFQPTTAWMMKRPQDGLIGVYMGDANGKVYRMEGTGAGDGGSVNITASRLSKMIELPEGQVFDVEGYVRYQQPLVSSALTLTLQHNGRQIFDQPITIAALQSTAAGSFFNDGNTYFGGGSYFSAAFTGRVARNKFTLAGESDLFQIFATVTGTNAFNINEIVLKLKVSRS